MGGRRVDARGAACSGGMPASYLDDAARRELRALSRATGRPEAELILEAINTYVETREPRSLPSFVGTSTVGGDAADP
jgi:hypothetical protein